MASASENAGTILGMAGTGAALGSVVPGIGTAVGAAGGALIGLAAVLYDELIAEGVPPEQAYTIAFQAQQAQTSDFDFLGAMGTAQARDTALAGQQDALIGQLTANAEGRGVPSLAEMQLARSLSQAQQNSAAAMASQRGLNPALAARMVGQQHAQMAQQSAAQGAMLRAQEQLAAQQLLGQTLAGTRGQEQSMFGLSSSGNQAQNALASANFNEAQRLNHQTAMFNAQAQENARRRELGLQQQADQHRRDASAGWAKTGAQMLGAAVPYLGGDGQRLNQYGTMPMGNGQTYDQYIADDANWPGHAHGGLVRGYADGGEVAGTAQANSTGALDRGALGLLHPPPDPVSAARANSIGALDRGMLALVPGTPAVAGDSERNDTVPALLSPGEVVVPRSVVTAPDAPDRAAAFVAKVKQEAQKDPAIAQTLTPPAGSRAAEIARLEAILSRLRDEEAQMQTLERNNRERAALFEAMRARPDIMGSVGVSEIPDFDLPLLGTLTSEGER